MSGLLWSALGQAVGNSTNAIGGYMMREADREDRQEERRRELEERRAYEERRDALYRRTAEQQNAGRNTSGGGGAGRIGPLTDDEKDNEALSLGMTRPEYDRFVSLQKTGDNSAYRTNFTTLDDEQGEMKGSAVDEATQRYLKAKQTMLAQIREERTYGKEVKDVVQSRRGRQEIDATNMALRKPGDAGLISQAVAAGDGKPMADVKDGTVFSPYTGANSATEKGKSEIDENKAQAEKYRADARKLGQEAKEALKTGNIEKLSTMLTSLNKFSENMELSPADRAAVKDIALQVTKAIGVDVSGRVGGDAGGGKAQPLKVGDVHDGMRYKGGNPREKGSWEAVAETQKPTKEDSKPDVETKPTKTRSNLETMSTSDLQRIAKIDGHVSQAAAKQELERRRQMWEDERSRSSSGSAAAFMP